MKRYARPFAIVAVLIVLGLNAGMYAGMILHGRAGYGLFVTLQVADMLGLLALLALLYRTPRREWALQAIDRAAKETPAFSPDQAAFAPLSAYHQGAEQYRARLLANFMRQVE